MRRLLYARHLGTIQRLLLKLRAPLKTYLFSDFMLEKHANTLSIFEKQGFLEMPLKESDIVSPYKFQIKV